MESMHSPPRSSPSHGAQGSAPKPLKRSLVHKLEPALAALATRGAPSRLVEAIFVSSDVEEKEVVARALAGDAAKLQVPLPGPANSVCDAGRMYGSWDRVTRRHGNAQALQDACVCVVPLVQDGC